MNKYLTALIFFLYSSHLFAQEDSLKRTGTIKVAKLKRDSVYVKTEMVFFQFQEDSKKDITKYPPKECVAPIPKATIAGGTFNYNRFFNKRINVKISDLENKTTDTVRIQVKILNNGKAYFKDLTPLLMLNGVLAYYDSKNNAYKLDAIHYKCLNALKEIEAWEPGCVLLEKKEKFKGRAVIKAKKKKLTSTGTLTVIFSLIPFDEQESQ